MEAENVEKSEIADLKDEEDRKIETDSQSNTEVEDFSDNQADDLEPEVEIPDPIDAVVNITVSADHLKATIFVTEPQFDGKEIDEKIIYDAIKESNITYGIKNDVINYIVNKKVYNFDVVFAEALAPINGDDGKIINHFSQIKKLTPKILNDDYADYRDLGLILNISRGTTICEIIYNTQGTPGVSVYGAELPPTPGKMPDIPMGTNTSLNGDASKLIAIDDGNLVFTKGKFNVETDFYINSDIDLSTGNIDFIGNITIKGNVSSGFIVKSGKSITIQGMVDSSTIIANDNITIKNGIFNSELTAIGCITIGFAENSRIKCKGNLKVTSLILCDVNIEGELDCTTNPGTIMGGRCVTVGNIIANTIGYKSYIPTNITCGSFAILIEEKIMLEDKINKLCEKIELLDKNVEYLKLKKRTSGKLDPEKEELLSNFVKQKVVTNLEKQPYFTRIKEIDGYISNVDNLSITIKRNLYPNVRIYLDKYHHTVQTEYGKCRVFIDEGEIKIMT